MIRSNGRGVALTDAGKRLFDDSMAVPQLVSHARGDLGAPKRLLAALVRMLSV